MPILSTDAIKDPSPQLQAALHWINALIETRDVQDLESAITDDFAIQVLPKSLGRPQLHKEEYLKYSNSFTFHVVRDFEATIQEVVETADKVVLHASSKATSATGFPYSNEYIIIFHLALQPDGQYKVKYLKEFVDSQFSTEFFPAERKRQEARELAAATKSE
ncbi:hypothetical protein BXZ70DRAFT_623247 [Cristinia sonorae]|uniref:SnoaL-like domain-containing protein n=1 Tax=Cristinia sonorae TaxID=1940300 RepID=A0A8K0UVV9_9AGAR|nr:hypothetical protein BXZ70DRAFT_623247 [Cristinia sonorae]